MLKQRLVLGICDVLILEGCALVLLENRVLNVVVTILLTTFSLVQKDGV